jgi:hypothetical protein
MLWLHPDTAISYNNIGLDINSKGDFDVCVLPFMKWPWAGTTLTQLLHLETSGE